MDIKKILELHAMWRRGEEGGIRADLSHAILSDAILSDAILRGAILRGADLRGADLSHAILSGADLSDADLSDAILRGADLSGANLSGANLSGANLPSIVIIDDFKKQILTAISAEGCGLDMGKWHDPNCRTVHCLAGWAVTLHPQGPIMEDLIGTNAAGALIFNACCGEVPNFYSSDKEAMAWLQKQS